MSSTLPSDEVAEDYKNSLEDLTLNSRYEIGNLTVIAKENMDHALAISRVIENHIRTAPPNRKLPALYVLDSVVKNVGTPYTLFFGRNLYQTYMTAYALVDAPIRKKLEEMLKTWKEPVPGSLDPRPVFPPEVTRTIENALIKARTAAVQLQQQQVRAQIGRSSTPYRSTPTPPTGTPVPLAQNLPIAQHQVAHATNFQSQARTTSPYATTQGANGAASQDHATQPSHSNAYSASLPAPPAGYLSNGSYVQQDSGGIDALMGDIINLIASARLEFATNPYDSAVQQRLKALLDLQTIVQTQALPPGQLRLIKDQVAQLSRDSAPLLPSTQPVTTPAVPQVSQASSRLQPPQHNASLQSILSPSTLAQLLASANAPQQTTSLQPSPASASLCSPPLSVPALPVAPPLPPSHSTGETSLLASLRAAGMLPPSANTPSLPPSIPASIAFDLPKSSPRLNLGTPPQPSSTMSRPALAELPNDVQLTSISLKMPRPHLISTLYSDLPNQCTTCGRRFAATPQGRQKKAKHLDWHFKVNLRMADATKRGQNRSWYVDEREWIHFRDDADETGGSGEGSSSVTANGKDSKPSSTTAVDPSNPRNQWVPVPPEPSMANSTCPICQEKFDMVWLDEAQEWVWMDAVRVGPRIFHASCHAEVAQGNSGTPVIGKRKAEEGESIPVRAKMKR